MKYAFLFLSLLCLAAQAQDYNGPVKPNINDIEQMSLQKINKLIADANASNVPVVATAIIWKVQTSATGTAFVTLPAIPCRQVRFLNLTGTTLEVQRNGAGDTLPVPDKGNYTFRAITNANQLSVRRVDVSNTQVTANGEAEQ